MIKRYVDVYGGDVYKRDSCYHQGTVWRVAEILRGVKDYEVY